MILFLVFWPIVILSIPHQFLDLGGDSAQYIILAQSISRGTGYRAVNYPDSPFCYHYPPVFPLLLSSIVYFFGGNLYPMHILIALLGFLSLLFLYKLFRKYADKEFAFLAVFLLATNYIFVIYSSNFILSDIPYVFFSGLALLFAARYLNKDNWMDKQGYLLLLFLTLAYFTRYAGVALFLGILIVLLSSSSKQKFRKFGFIFSGFILFFLLWQAIARSFNPSAAVSYSKQFLLIDPYQPFLGTLLSHPQFIFVRFIAGVNYYCKILGGSFFFYFIRRWHFLAGPLSLFSFLIILLGLWQQFRKDKSCVFCYYFLIYFLLIVFWPFGKIFFREGARFILPILPFAYFYFLVGIKKIFSFLPERISHPCFYSIISLLLIFNIAYLPLRSRTFQDLSHPSQNFISLNLWVKQNLPAKGVIFSRMPATTSFYTGHKSIVYPFTPEPDKIWKSIKKNNIRYIIVDSFSRETYHYLLPFLYKYQNKLKLLHKTGNTGVLEILNK